MYFDRPTLPLRCIRHTVGRRRHDSVHRVGAESVPDVDHWREHVVRAYRGVPQFPTMDDYRDAARSAVQSIHSRKAYLMELERRRQTPSARRNLPPSQLDRREEEEY